MKQIKNTSWTSFMIQRNKARIVLTVMIALFKVTLVLAQPGGYAGGSGQWIEGNGKIYATGVKVGIGTNAPVRSLHIRGAGHRYMRATSTGGTQYHTYVAGLELQRILDNGQQLRWDLVNQNGFKIRRNSSTLFHLQLDEVQFGTQSNKTSMYIWGKPILGGLNEGTLALRNYLAGQYQTLRLDGDQLESDTDFYINFSSDQDVALVHGGGKVRIGTQNNEARLNIASEGYQLKLVNPGNQGASWRIGAANNTWAAGAGKLVFTNTSSSNDATMVMTEQGQVGIGKTNPGRTLDISGSVRASSIEINGKTTTNVLEITGGADLAEPFEMSDGGVIQPGMVVAIDPMQAGQLRIAKGAYDKTVAGIVSGAGNIHPGMVMGQDGTLASGEHPVALTGRVYCQVDATYGAIQPGDLLTTSDTPGYAMKVTDHDQAQGAIIGKAMTSLKEGQGLVLVLVSLQ